MQAALAGLGVGGVRCALEHGVWKTAPLMFIFCDNFYLISSTSIPERTSVCPAAAENEFVQTTGWHGMGQCAKQDAVANAPTFCQRQITLLFPLTWNQC